MARRRTILLVLVVLLPLGVLVNAAPVARAAPIDPVICDGPYPLTNSPEYGTAYRAMMLPEIVSGAPARGGYTPPKTPTPRDWGTTTPQECVQLNLNEPWIPIAWIQGDPPGPSPSNPCPVLTVSGRFFTLNEADRIVDVSEPAEIKVRTLPLTRALMDDGSDAKSVLMDEDGQAAVLDPGMRITLLFDREAGRERGQTYVFATVGRYELLVR